MLGFKRAGMTMLALTFKQHLESRVRQEDYREAQAEVAAGGRLPKQLEKSSQAQPVSHRPNAPGTAYR